MFEFLKIAIEFWIEIYNAPAIDMPNTCVMIAPLLAAFLPIIASAGGSLLDKLFGSKGTTSQEAVQQQQQASRFNVLTPFGSSEWEGDNQIKRLSPQMQDMMDRKFDYRNSALDNALNWFGGPEGNSASDFRNTEMAPGVGDAGDMPTNPGFPGSLQPGDDGLVSQDDAQAIVDWGVEMGWGDDISKWGVDGNAGIPYWRVEQGKFPTNLDPAAMQTWWQNYAQGEPPMDTP